MFLVIAALENIVKKIFFFEKVLIYISFLFDIILIVNIHIFNLFLFEFFLPSKT